ncbi:MAG: hypothetical protein RLZZ455_156 [Candidatus Parcubacteria bacterium]|jgi:hypothetical protein
MKLASLLTTLLFLLVIAPGSVSAQAAEESTTVTLTPTPVVTVTETTRRTAVLTQAAARKEAVLTQSAARKSAVLTQGATRKENAASKAAERKEQRQETTLENLKKRSLSEIDRRLKSLSGIMTKISSLKKLSDTQKATLSTQVQTEITNLTSLRSKIEADTDLETLKTDAKSIVSSYRIYALFIPKIHILTGAEATLTAIEKMSSAHAELNSRADAAATAGADTTEIETLLTTMQALITSATTNTNAAISTVTPLTPDGYPANKTSLEAARESLKKARENLMEAYKTAKEITKLLRQIPSTSTVTSTPSATVN